MTSPTQGKARRYEDFDWYEAPRYYDAIYDVDTDLEATFLEAAYKRHATPGRGRRVLEPACGSGRLLAAMAGRGWRVRGFDLGGAMVRYSRERLRSEGLAGTVVQDDMATFKVPGTFDLAHCLVSTFKYLLSERDARGHLRAVAQALRPGGVYVLGFHLSRYGASRKAHERWRVERGGAQVDCTVTTWPPDRTRRRERVEARMRVVEDGEERRSRTSWEFRTYDAAEVLRMLRAVPELEHVGTYDFHYEIDEPQSFSDRQFDTILVLKRRA
ncbi:MAG: class I SAM-dependent methyltransferase [Planctomycetota bacterium]|nr:class I SAM-dependent methyltransferase [Planctomycetota bacterium]